MLFAARRRRAALHAPALPVLASALALGLLTAAAPPAHAADAAQGARSSVGGDLLSHRGVIVHPTATVPKPPSVSASAYVVADLDTGEILAAKDPHGYYLPASTLKILTAETLIPRLSPTSTVVATNEDADVDGSKVGVVPKMRYTVADLMTAMLVVSGNDAARTVATAYGGQDKAIAAMNAEAQRLRALDTVAKTPNGLDAAGQHSSAYDLALISRAALQLPDFQRYVLVKKGYFPAPHHKKFEIYTHNHLLLNYPGTIGVKNGYTIAARATFVGAADRGGHRLLVSLMHADPSAWKEARALLDWGFRADGRITPVGQLVDPVPPPTPSAAPAVATDSRKASASTPARSSNGLPMPPMVAIAVIIVGFVVVRLRSRSGRRRQRFSLPPL